MLTMKKEITVILDRHIVNAMFSDRNPVSRHYNKDKIVYRGFSHQDVLTCIIDKIKVCNNLVSSYRIILNGYGQIKTIEDKNGNTLLTIKQMKASIKQYIKPSLAGRKNDYKKS